MQAHPASKSGTLGYFDREAAAWSDKYLGKGHFRTRLETVLGWINAERQKNDVRHVLDFGCGSGVFIDALLSQELTVTGVDASPGMIEASRTFLTQRQPDAGSRYHLEVVDGQTFEGAYRQQTYDGACCLGVLEYVENDTFLLQRLAETIRPGGFLIVSVPNENSLLRQLEKLVHGNPGLFKALGLFPHLTGPDSYLQFQKHQYSLDALTRAFQPLGLTPVASRFHVTPGPLKPLEGSPLLGMTFLLKLRKK